MAYPWWDTTPESHRPLVTWSRKATFFTFMTPTATKLDRMVTYDKGSLPIESCDTLITWSQETV